MLCRYRDGNLGAGRKSEASTRLKEADSEFAEDIKLLDSFSLISTTKDEGGFNMHGLVQFATRVWLGSTGAEEAWWERFVAAMAAVFPTAEYGNLPICRALFPHIQSITEKQPQERQSEEWTQILTDAGGYAWQQGLIVQAKELVQQSLAECDRRFSTEDFKTLININLLGCVGARKGTPRV